MKKEEIIELNGTEYTVVLNRESFLRIDKYANLNKAASIIEKNLYEYVEEIEDGMNPFEDEIDEENFIKEKENVLKELVKKAFWIWLYPNYKFDYSKVCELIEPLFEDSEKSEFIINKYTEFLSACTSMIPDESKNLDAQSNKK